MTRGPPVAVLLRDPSPAYEAALQALGFLVVFRPVLDIIGRAGVQAPRRGVYGAAVVTSANAAKRFPGGVWLDDLRQVYVIGKATGDVLAQAHPSLRDRVVIHSQASTAAALAAELSAVDGPVLFVCGDPHRTEISSLSNVDDLVVYESRPAESLDDLLRFETGDHRPWLVIFSPVGASLASTTLNIDRWNLATIGPTTASALPPAATAVAVARQPTAEALADAIRANGIR